MEKVRSSNKFSFNLNPGVIKRSIIHSFKGVGSPTVICILSAQDSEEMVYTGITRTEQTLLVFIQKESRFLEFFKKDPNMDFHLNF